MINSTYNWIGLIVGSICILLVVLALGPELQPPIDAGQLAFTLVFGAFWAVVASACAYTLLHTKSASSGLLVIGLVVGSLMVLTGLTLMVPQMSQGIDDPMTKAIFLGGGLLLVVPTGLVLWHRRSPIRTEFDREVRLWQGIVVGVLTIFLCGAIIFVTTGDPYEIGLTAHLVLGGIAAAGAVLIAVCAVALRQGRPREEAPSRRRS